jgi:hypothetical protein
LFCKKCTKLTAPISYYGIKEPAKVCDRCHGELQNENIYVDIHRALLLKGENFTKYSYMGMKSRMVELRLLNDMKSLVYDEKIAVNKKPTVILLETISKITVSGSVNFTLFALDGKSYEFEALSTQKRVVWVEALSEAVHRSRLPTLKEKVHRERRERNESKYKMEDLINRQRQVDASKADRQSRRDEIRNKYMQNRAANTT